MCDFFKRVFLVNFFILKTNCVSNSQVLIQPLEPLLRVFVFLTSKFLRVLYLLSIKKYGGFQLLKFLRS